MNKGATLGRLLQDGGWVADVATVSWSSVNGKLIPWTGWLTVVEGVAPVTAGRFTLVLPDGTAGTILLMAAATPGKVVPFCYAEPAAPVQTCWLARRPGVPGQDTSVSGSGETGLPILKIGHFDNESAC